MNYVFFLGSHPELAAAEALRVLHYEHYEPVVVTGSRDVLIVDLERNLPDTFLTRLGGTHRIGLVIAQQKQAFEPEQIAHSFLSASKKVTVGLSALDISIDSLKALAYELKQLLKSSGVRLRFILPRGKLGQLNTAQVLFNRLHRPPNCELTLLHHEDTFYVTRTIQVQDIQAYELRDTRRPARTMRVGMLPPKLAQIMINLVPYTTDQPTIYDPFCGTGTVLQEGWLKGHTMLGSDEMQVMVDATRRNLKWLSEHFIVDRTRTPHYFLHDARQFFPRRYEHTVDAIVTEPYLGKPLSSPLSPTAAELRMQQLGELYLHFFRSVLPVLKSRGHILFLLPAFRRTRRGRAFWLFPPAFLDAICRLGYRKVQLVPKELTQWYTAERTTALYARPDALVGREFTLWQKLD